MDLGLSARIYIWSIENHNSAAIEYADFPKVRFMTLKKWDQMYL